MSTLRGGFNRSLRHILRTRVVFFQGGFRAVWHSPAWLRAIPSAASAARTARVAQL